MQRDYHRAEGYIRATKDQCEVLNVTLLALPSLHLDEKDIREKEQSGLNNPSLIDEMRNNYLSFNEIITDS